MLVLTKKQYEIEEPVQLKDDKDNILYEFTMQITSNEMKKIKDLLFNQEIITMAEEIGRKEAQKEYDEDLYKKFQDKTLKIQEEFENICFKEHKKPFKKIDEYKYIEMVDMLYDFFMNIYIEKRMKQANTLNTSLMRIGNK